MRPGQVGGRGSGDAAFGMSLGQTDAGADLGGSSKYSHESFEYCTENLLLKVFRVLSCIRGGSSLS